MTRAAADWTPLIQLAQHPPWRSMGSRFRGAHARFDGGDILTGLAILAVVVVGLWLLSRLLSRQDRRRVYHNPRALFRSLCRAHALDRPARQLLWQVARAQQLVHPARLFVEADRLAAAKLSTELKRHQAALTAIRKRIFADDD